MKSFLSFLAIAAVALTLTTSKSEAHVRIVAMCSTSDGLYQIIIINNKSAASNGIDDMTAMIRNKAGGVLGSYNVERYVGPQSVSFGRPKYQDRDTKGTEFLLAGPSTNQHNYLLTAKLNSAVDAQDPKTLDDSNLSCSVFNGAVLN